MTIPFGGNLYSIGGGSRPEDVEIPHYDTRSPASTDVNYPLGKRWINTTAASEYSLCSFSSSLGTISANWSALGGGGTAVATLTGNIGSAVSPHDGNINVFGSGTLAFVGSSSTLTGSITGGTSGQVLTSNGSSDASFQDIPGINFIATGPTTLVANTGYFATTVGTYTLPASPTQGNFIILICDTSLVVTIRAPALTSIRLGSNVSSVAGSITSTAIGDSIVLRYKTASLTWYAESGWGNWGYT